MELLAPKIREQPTERTVEYKFVLDQLKLLKGRKILDIGVGPNPSLWYMLNTMGYQCLGTDLKHRATHSFCMVDDITNTALHEKSFDAVLCISTLEHIPDYMKAVENMARLVNDDGLIIMTFPFSNEYIANTVEGGYTQSFSWDEIHAMPPSQAYLEIKYWKCWTGKRWREGERLAYPEETDLNDADLIGIVCKSG